ncbi:MAG: bifunctional (p)ppGpp synthetase/guanosine-3',5'-bis(diphosphate) 3'-pyrophosphohydrolase [Clostridiales bacterium]|nr:bifunctional (p)ppGpp synthetase/guanosine-3',5'-bis(diphosphate) 3'-pyrophosphohydrolase [Clostridiales bacterium]
MQKFLEKAKGIYNEGDYLAIRYAVDFAYEKHKGQKRASGEDYIIHPLSVADILIDLNMDSDTVIASLLHDVIEDTDISEEEIKSKFGAKIEQLVAGVTKLTRISVKETEEEKEAENIRRLFLAMSADIRVLLIKLADRLHNMRTLNFLPPEKQAKKAKETLGIYAPLAGRIGISWIKCELEDLSMKYLYKEDFKELNERLAQERINRMVLVNRIADKLDLEIKDVVTPGYEIKGRPKHIYSIYLKMKTQDKDFDQIHDLIALRVIVKDIRDCYSVLGIVHSLWKPIPGRFKDYIAVPKPNMYQSLHTTVINEFGEKFEIQIRTFEMDKVAEYGIAAHWKYKEGKDFFNKTSDARVSWMKDMLEVQSQVEDSIEFVDTLKRDVSLTEIYVFSPKGNVFNLPQGSTCIDFAYRVHSEVGNRCVGAKVNKKIVPLSTQLQNGDVVEILTSNQSKGPSRDWLKITVTSSAKAKIKSFFKKQTKDENIKLGREMLEREARHKGYNYADISNPNWLKVIIDRYNFNSIEDMYASVGYGGTSTNQILFKLIDFYKKSQALSQAEALLEKGVSDQHGQKTRIQHKHSGILIDGYDDFLIKLSHCCNPVPGDKIIGYITRGRGVMVHRENCPNMRNVEAERKMPAAWSNWDDSVYTAKLRVESDNRKGILGQLASVLTSLKLNIVSANARVLKNSDIAVISFGVEIRKTEELENAIKKLSQIEGVLDVHRDNR